MPDYAIANEWVWPTANDISSTSGDGNKLRENAMSPWRVGLDRNYVITGFGAPLSSANLDISIPAGEAMISGYRVVIPGSTTVTCAASTTNYIFLKLTRDGSNKVNAAVFERNTGVDPSESVLICTAITSGSAITDTVDARVRLPHTMGGWFGLYNTGSGSAISMNGYSLIGSDVSMGGLNIYGSLRLKAGVTITLNQHCLILYAERSIDIAGTINGAGVGHPGGPGGTPPTDGESGTDQPGAGGSGDNTSFGGNGGNAIVMSDVLKAGGAAGNPGAGSSVSSVAGAVIGRAFSVLSALSGGGGGGGGRTSSGGLGGAGGGSIILIAPVITLRSTAILRTFANAGAASSAGVGGGGGGGGAGNIWILARSGQFTDSGATFLQAGGAGGAGSGGGQAGGAGANGVKQIMLFF